MNMAYERKRQQEQLCTNWEKKSKRQHNKNADSDQIHPGTFQQQNNRPQDNKENIHLPGPPLIQSPHQCNLSIDQKDGGSVFAPCMVGNVIMGDVIMNQQAPQLSHSISESKDEIVQKVKDEMKTRMKRDSERIFEGCESKSVFLNKIYTELFIIDDASDPINREHEIWQIETTHDLSTSKQINYNQVLHPMDKDETMKTVLTKGIAGIGKTVTVQKFIHDWANGETNQDLDFVFLLPFRELNLHEGQKSLSDVLSDSYPELKKETQIFDWICERKVLFILDGLDEYKEPLNFQSRVLSSVTEAATVDVLLVNLLRRKLLPSAHLWITSRPVAEEQLPREIFLHGYKTQIRGFRDEQKEEYFTRQFEDPVLTQKVVCHLKAQRSLWILCHIPLFCWISSVVLRHIIESPSEDRNMPANMTEMYIHYLLIQTGLSHWKYQSENLSQEEALLHHRDLILKLAALAYGQLKEQKVIFRKEELENYDITVEESSQYPGVITCVSDCSNGYHRRKLFSFVHLSVQEFFAAFFAFHEFVSRKQDSLNLFTAKNRQKFDLSDFLKNVMDTALQSKNGHLDLFSRFIFGISCASSRSLLQDLLPPYWGRTLDCKTVITYVKSLRRKDLSSERCISLVYCLVELKDVSFLQDLKELERSRSTEPLTPFTCTLLAYHFVMSDTKHKEFDLQKYNITLEGFRRFSPAIRCIRKALLKGSGLTEQHCEILEGYLSSSNSHLMELDLSHNGLRRAALKPLSRALRQPSCQIQMLNLSHNELQSLDMELIGEVLSGEHMSLRVLDLSDNPLGDSGVRTLSSGLQSANCHLEVLKLSGCEIEADVCDLVSCLKSSSYLRELDLRYNHLEMTDLELLPLRISTGGVCGHQPGLEKYAVTLTFDPQTANEHLYLDESNTVVTRQKEKQTLPANDQRFDKCNQVLSHLPLRGRSFFAVDVIGPDVHVGVAFEGMKREGQSDAALLGYNKMSWSLRCSDKVCVALHNSKAVSLPNESIRRLGVFVDQEAGSVCFYQLIPHFMLLYVFDADFPKDQDLYAAFRLHEPNSSVRLGQGQGSLRL